MKSICRLFFALIVTGTLFGVNPVNADVMPLKAFPMGGAASPALPHETIRMDSEDVMVRLQKGSYAVEVVFHFFNTGETETVWVGFPKRGIGRSNGISDFFRFDAWVNGRKVEFTEESNLHKEPDLLKSRILTKVRDDPRVPLMDQRTLRRFDQRIPKDIRWLAQHITFQGHARTTIRVSYEAHYGRGEFGGARADYLYGTGLYWKDSIGRAIFTIDATDIGGTEHIEVYAPNFRARKLITDKAVRYEVRDLKPEPDDEIEIIIGRSK